MTYAPDFGDVIDGLANDHVVSRTRARQRRRARCHARAMCTGDPYWAPPAAASYLDAIKRKPKRLRIAFATKKLDGSQLHPDCVAAVKAAANLCEARAMNVEEASPAARSGHADPGLHGVSGPAILPPASTMIARLTGQTPTPRRFRGPDLGAL